ncbi:MAG: aldo/keto reductase [Anaerolineales bacterium]
MERRRFGKTGLEVSVLGAGLAEIGDASIDDAESQASLVLNTALDAGINFLDTSACYGISEQLIGRTIAHRRQHYILATKCGHITAGYEGEEWTVETIKHSIERSLKRMKTDYLDLVQLHSCGLDILEHGEVTQALLDARQAGKTRFIGYSGDNEAAEWAVESGLFDTLQTSFSVVDQRARIRLFTQAKAKDMGIIVKRPIANAVWGMSASPSEYAAQYFQRAQEMLSIGPIPESPSDPILLSLGFTLAHDVLDTAIVGTRNPEHMRANIKMVENELPISGEVVSALHRRFERFEEHWIQLG